MTIINCIHVSAEIATTIIIALVVVWAATCGFVQQLVKPSLLMFHNS